MPSTLPINRLVNVTVTLTPEAAQAQDLQTLLLIGNNGNFPDRYKDYSTFEEVTNDFVSTDPEYKSAQLWFSQVPQPTTLKIGRWVEGTGPAVGAKWYCSTPGGLINFGQIGQAQYSIKVNGVWYTTAVFNPALPGGSPDYTTVAANIEANQPIGIPWPVDVAYSASGSGRFIFSISSGYGVAIEDMIDGGGAWGGNSGFVRTCLRGLREQGAYGVAGYDPGSIEDELNFFITELGQTWYALMMAVDSLTDQEVLGVAGTIEATTTKHIFAVNTSDANTLIPGNTTCIAAQLQELGYKRTLVQYQKTPGFAAASLLGRALTTNWNGVGTAITLAFKTEPGIVPEYLNSTQANALRDANVNAFLAFNNGTAIILNGVMIGGTFIDVITGTDWLAVTLQNSLYNVLYTSTTKIPQTDAGMHVLLTVAESVCIQAVINGLLAPGTWNSNGFGVLKYGDFMPKGYYIYAPPVGTQNPADRVARKSVPITIAAKLAGAVHEVAVAVTVNQ